MKENNSRQLRKPPRNDNLILKTTTILAFMVSIVSTTKAQPLSSYQWQYRPMVIFAPNEAFPSLTRQRRIVRANTAGFLDRDIVVIQVAGNAIRSLLGPSHRASAASLRQYYSVGHKQFRVIFIGKDGGSKLRSSSPVNAGRLFQLIDSMPMRRQEMLRLGR